MDVIKNYDKAFEDLFINILISNVDILIRTAGIIKSEYFDHVVNRKTVQFILDYCNEYSSVPLPDQIKVTTGANVELVSDVAYKHHEWALNEIEEFCKYKALRDAILASPALLDEGRYGEALAAVKAAVEIALVKDLGTDYYANPKERLEALRDNDGKVSTGWKDVDEKLYGGLGRGELAVFCGQSGAGKSLFLQNLAVNWATVGFNVLYLSLELSEKLCAMRIDAMHTGYETREIMRNIDNVHMKVRASHQKGKGSLRIKQLPNGCTANDIRAYVKEYEIQSGIKVDAILLDYLDLMMPAGRKISAENLFVKDKYVSEELRNLAIELNTVLVSAAQLNRNSYENVEFDPSHISGGISKVNTADNVFGIFTSPAMRDGGRYQIQFMKTRSSSGVGSRVDLSFNIKSLRISDLEDGDPDAIAATTSTIYERIKNKSVIKTTEKTDMTTGEISKILPEVRKVDPLEGAAALRAFIKNR